MLRDGLHHCRICGAPARKAMGVPFRLVCKQCQEVLDLERQERIMRVRYLLSGDAIDRPSPLCEDDS